MPTAGSTVVEVSAIGLARSDGGWGHVSPREGMTGVLTTILLQRGEMTVFVIRAWMLALIDSSHAFMMTILSCLCKTMAQASSAKPCHLTGPVTYDTRLVAKGRVNGVRRPLAIPTLSRASLWLA
jgi:hypothetical protein